MIVFFFKQKTAYEMRISDRSSDVCSSDLVEPAEGRPVGTFALAGEAARRHAALERGAAGTHPLVLRARVGIGGDHGAAESIGGDQKRRGRRQREAFHIAAENSETGRGSGREQGGQ